MRGDGEAGETLVESVVSLLILSVAVVAVVTSVEVAAQVTLSHRRVTVADTAAKTNAEAVKGMPYVAGATGYSGLTAPSGFTVTTSVLCLPLGSASVNVATDGTSCASDSGVQAVTVTVRSASGRESESVTVVKRQ